MKHIRLIAIILLLMPVAAYAQKWKETKVVEHKFKTTLPLTLEGDIKFANISVVHWDKPYASAKFEIKVEGENKKDVVSMLDRYKVTFKEDGANAYISASGFDNHIPKKGKNEIFSTDVQCMIYLPEKSNLTLNVQFGDVRIDKLDGVLDLNTEFGDTHIAGKLSKGGDINVKMGKITGLSSAKKLKIAIDKGGVKFNEADILEIQSKFSNIDLDSVRKLNITHKYGDYLVRFVDSLGSNEFNFGDLKVINLNKNAEIRNRVYSNIIFNSDTVSRMSDIEDRMRQKEPMTIRKVNGDLIIDKIDFKTHKEIEAAVKKATKDLKNAGEIDANIQEKIEEAVKKATEAVKAAEEIVKKMEEDLKSNK